MVKIKIRRGVGRGFVFILLGIGFNKDIDVVLLEFVVGIVVYSRGELNKWCVGICLGFR